MLTLNYCEALQADRAAFLIQLLNDPREGLVFDFTEDQH
jgi:hypothetical protein